jgi:hypothetical protein
MKKVKWQVAVVALGFLIGIPLVTEGGRDLVAAMGFESLWVTLLVVAVLLGITGWMIARVARTVPELNQPYTLKSEQSALQSLLPPMLVVTAYLVIRQTILLYHMLREPVSGSNEHALLMLNIIATFLTMLLLPFPLLVPTISHKPRWVRYTAWSFWVLLCAVPVLLQFFGSRMIRSR